MCRCPMPPIWKSSRCLRLPISSRPRRLSVTGEEMMNTYQALSVPPAGRERGGMEVLRSGIVDGELHVTLRPAFNDPQQWGRLLAEVARQVAGAYAHERMFTAAEALSRISASFDADIKSSPEVISSVGPIGSVGST